ncbi:hypothetical protein AAFC00_004167 [Neodothiora populina]
MTDYAAWSNEQLVKRVTELEAQLKKQNDSFQHGPNAASAAVTSPPLTKFVKTKKPKKPFDPSKYHTRLIALKFAYLGQRYNGFEHHTNNTTPLPTIEEELFKALTKTRLIFPTRLAELSEGEIDWEGTEYSKCGRTDRGVSAFGQVIGIRVRSSRPTEETIAKTRAKAEAEAKAAEADGKEYVRKEEKDWDPIADELAYIQLLNRVLPEDIRMLAWCPTPPEGFSARFSCRERRYRYFFTQPAFAPVPGSKGMIEQTAERGSKPMREGWLDIEAMQDAAKRLEGLHDFRNFCKVDPAKQITNFERRIFHASVTEVPMNDGPVGYVGQPEFAQWSTTKGLTSLSNAQATPGGPPKVYTFNVNGSAFLWHQVRHLVAVMFLVGQGLEPPSVVSDLLDMEKYPTRPKYEMATDAPLVLWDCIFPGNLEFGEESQEDTLNWIYVGDTGGRETNKSQEKDGGDGKYGRGGIMDDLWQVWHERKIDEVLAGSLLDVVAAQGKGFSVQVGLPPHSERSVRVFDGGNWARPVGTYTPIKDKARMDTVDVINARYAERKGYVNGKRPPKEQVDEMVE